MASKQDGHTGPEKLVVAILFSESFLYLFTARWEAEPHHFRRSGEASSVGAIYQAGFFGDRQ